MKSLHIERTATNSLLSILKMQLICLLPPDKLIRSDFRSIMLIKSHVTVSSNRITLIYKKSCCLFMRLWLVSFFFKWIRLVKSNAVLPPPLIFRYKVRNGTWWKHRLEIYGERYRKDVVVYSRVRLYRCEKLITYCAMTEFEGFICTWFNWINTGNYEVNNVLHQDYVISSYCYKISRRPEVGYWMNL